MSSQTDIQVNDSSEDPKSYVVAGAVLSCNSGTQLSRLKMPLSHGVYIKDNAQMNVDDYKSGVNIMPFGYCCNPQNPAVQNGRVDIEGVKKAPCLPIVDIAWRNGKTDKLVEGSAALLDHCTTSCMHGGEIFIVDNGQNLGGTKIG
ncbi:DUF4280 domain-containing protein [Paenibacillus gorillae]|uniref:DUF4280 domain-containing protein n=1 Tax=Paenibacillus gorillae TaxID=1243662 RepID=UPI0004BC3397|nr:DUF4280 domain-containing protein [Paenibacillus gorillae]